MGMGLPKPNMMQDDPSKGDYVNGKDEFLKLIPVTVADDGYTEITGQRQATAISAVMDGNTVTVTTTMQGDVTHTDIITLDENGYPVSIVADGVECAMEFVGFGETEGTETTEDGGAEGGGGE